MNEFFSRRRGRMKWNDKKNEKRKKLNLFKFQIALVRLWELEFELWNALWTFSAGECYTVLPTTISSFHYRKTVESRNVTYTKSNPFFSSKTKYFLYFAKETFCILFLLSDFKIESRFFFFALEPHLALWNHFYRIEQKELETY